VRSCLLLRGPLSFSRSNRQRSCNEADIGKLIAVLGLYRSMARMRRFYRLGVRDFANLIAVLISLEPLQRRSHLLSPDVLSCSIMLVAAVAPSTKVVPDLFPLSLRSIPRGTKRAAPAPLRCASPSVCKGLSQLQSDHHCNANKEKSNDHELHQIHK